MRYLPYNQNLKKFSRQLRNHSTFGEIILWNRLRARGMMGYQFNRQKPLGNYIVDFYCQALKFVIEIDGKYHNSEETCVKDDERDALLEAEGLFLLRFSEHQVKYDRENVMRSIEHFMLDMEEKDPSVLLKKIRKSP